LPIRLHVPDQAADFKRYGERYNAFWTPTVLELDPDGVELHRIEGFLPADDFIAQLALGLAHAAFKRQDWEGAAHRFSEIAARHDDSDAAAEATYWAGVARYKASGDPKNLTETAEAFHNRFEGTTWSKKASVWEKQPA
jgi:TolA-binding protein